MPFGIGTDIIDIMRFKVKPLKNNLNFYKKIFSDSEIKYCQKFRSSHEHFAGKFAIKEAFCYFRIEFGVNFSKTSLAQLTT